MKSRMIIGMVACWVICALLAPSCLAAAADTEAVPLPREEMLGGTYSTGPDGEAILSFNARPGGARDLFAYGSGAATVGASGGAFSGDYTAAGIESVALKFETDGHLPLNAYLVLRANGKEWQNGDVNVSQEAGKMVLSNISFERSAGWDTPTRHNKDELWAAALSDVISIGIRVAPKGPDAQVYTVSDFMLIGPGGLQIPVGLSPLAGRLMQHFNRSTLAGVGSLGDGDSDGDGMSDLDEAIVGTDDEDAASIFAAQVLQTTDLGTTIKWSSALADVTYKVFRSEALASGFSAVAKLTLAGVDVIDGECVWTDSAAAGDGPYFYRVVAEVVE